jgi:hypothetical protein
MTGQAEQIRAELRAKFSAEFEAGFRYGKTRPRAAPMRRGWLSDQLSRMAARSPQCLVGRLQFRPYSEAGRP